MRVRGVNETPTLAERVAAGQRKDDRRVTDGLGLPGLLGAKGLIIGDTYSEDGVRQWLPYETAVEFATIPATTRAVRFGAFVGWPDSFDPLLALAAEDIESVRPMMGLSHQTGGHHCIQQYFTVFPASIMPSMVGPIGEFCRSYYHSFGGSFCIDHESFLKTGDRDLRDYYEKNIAAYEAAIGRLGFSAEHHFRHRVSRFLAEGAYPIDLSRQSLDRLTALPDELWGQLGPYMRVKALRDAASIYIITENSD
jgi:hypothetical protein